MRERDPASGIRDLEAVQALAAQAGLTFLADIEMPANNRCLVWRALAQPLTKDYDVYELVQDYTSCEPIS